MKHNTNRPEAILHELMQCKSCFFCFFLITEIVFVVREGESAEPEVRRMVRYPDSQQLFVGNVPHDVDRAELKEFFERKSPSLWGMQSLNTWF